MNSPSDSEGNNVVCWVWEGLCDGLTDGDSELCASEMVGLFDGSNDVLVGETLV